MGRMCTILAPLIAFAAIASASAPAARGGEGTKLTEAVRVALETGDRARLTELGSGIDARATRFEVDGRPVPSEWDAEARVLRWRPRTPPDRGSHRYVVVATDRAANVRRLAARFTVN